MKRNLVILTISLLLGLCHALEVKKMTILEMSDLHSFLAAEFHDLTPLGPNDEPKGTLGHVLEFYERLQQRDGVDTTYFLSSGDNHQGTSLSDAEKPIPGVTNIQLLFNYSGDNFISGIGNHDLDPVHSDWVRDETHSSTDEVFRGRYLSTNVKLTNATTNEQKDYFTNSRFLVRDVDGLKVMFFSVLEKTINYLPDWAINLDPATSLDAEFEAFYNAEKPDVIIDLIHAGLYTAYESSEHTMWVKLVNDRLLQIMNGVDIPIIHLHGHDHRRYESTCQNSTGDIIPNCVHYDIRANFQELAVISLNFTREFSNTTYTMNSSRYWISNTLPKLAKYFNLETFPCGETCQTVDSKVEDYIEEYSLRNPVAWSPTGHFLPKGDIKWWYANSTYGLFFYELAEEVFGKQDFYICTGSMMKGGLSKGLIPGNDLWGYAPYDNHMVRVSGVTSKVLYGITHKNKDPPSTDVSEWPSLPTESGGVHFVYPWLNTSDITKEYTLNVVSYDIGRLSSACAKFGANCVFEEFTNDSARTRIHAAILKKLPLDAQVQETSKDGLPTWAWAIIVIGICTVATVVSSIVLTKKNKRRENAETQV